MIKFNTKFVQFKIYCTKKCIRRKNTMKRFKDMKSKWALILAFVMIVSVVVPAVLFSATDNVNAATGKSYDKTSLSYTGTYTDISLKKDADFKNAKYVSSSDEIISALQSAKAGDVIIIKGGTYKFSTSVIVNNTINGQDGSYIIVKAEDNHDVKFDFSAQVFNSQNRGFILDGDYWYFGGINFYGAGDNGVLLAGNNNIFERCVFEANRDTGLQLSRYDTTAATKDLWPSNNLIINCTAFNNCDFPEQGGTGENADGFAAKLTCGEGNVFDGCISYCNSDDGWDLYAKSVSGEIGAVTIENCVTYNNGWLTTDDVTAKGYEYGEGNGFKLGGGQMKGAHVLKNSISFDNHAKGITSNSCPDCKIINCISYNNSLDNSAYNVGLNTKDSNIKAWEVTGLISLNNSKNTKLEDLIPFALHSENNYIYDGAASYNNKGEQATEDWFENVDTSVKPTRNEDGTINMHNLLLLKDTSKNTGAVLDVTSDAAKSVKPAKTTVVEEEKVVYEMRQDADGNWHYYANDKIATDYCGMALNEYGWWYIKNGDVDFTYTGTAGGISTTDSLT